MNSDTKQRVQDRRVQDRSDDRVWTPAQRQAYRDSAVDARQVPKRVYQPQLPMDAWQE